MKKIIQGLMMSVLALCFMTSLAAGKAEAAKVAVIPLVVAEDVQDESGMCSMLYSDACVKYFQYPEYDLVDSDLVNQAVAGQTDLFSEAAMRNIAQATGADIVFAMSLERFDAVEDRTHREETMNLDQRGHVAVFNQLTGKYKNNGWRNSNSMELGFLARTDWPHDEFGRAVRRVVKSAVK